MVAEAETGRGFDLDVARCTNWRAETGDDRRTLTGGDVPDVCSRRACQPKDCKDVAHRPSNTGRVEEIGVTDLRAVLFLDGGGKIAAEAMAGDAEGLASQFAGIVAPDVALGFERSELRIQRGWYPKCQQTVGGQVVRVGFSTADGKIFLASGYAIDGLLEDGGLHAGGRIGVLVDNKPVFSEFLGLGIGHACPFILQRGNRGGTNRKRCI